MASKTFNTRIQLRGDLLSNWTTNNPVLLENELAVVIVPAESGAATTEPTVLFKVGDGTKTFSQLDWTSALAADVYGWAKAAKKPEYNASEIGGLADYIAGKVEDTNTKYQLIQDAVNGRQFSLQSQDLGANEWTTVSTITIPETVYTLATGTANGTVSFNGQDVAVAGLKSAAYAEATAFDAAGSAAAVLGAEGDESSAATVYGAKKAASEALSAAQSAQTAADGKVASVGAGDASVTVAGTATAPTVAVKLDPAADNALKLGEAGLKVEIGAAPEYSIVKAESAGDYAAVYNLTKDGVAVGASINIPKDMVVESGAVVENPEGQPAGTYIELVLQNVEEPLYINVGSLIEYVTSGSQAGDMVVISISDDHKVTASITDGSITLAKLATGVQTSLGLADSALQKADITAGSANGTIAVEGTDVAVTGLKGAAFVDTSAFDAAGVGAQEAAAVKTALIGTDADTAESATIAGAKKYADAQAATVDGKVTTLAGRVGTNEGHITTLQGEVQGLGVQVEANKNALSGLATIARTGNINDAQQTAGDYIIFNCGTSAASF